jgi:hypothetical protein
MGKEFEPCKSCETLKIQLDIERATNAQLLESLLNIARPTVVEQPVKTIQPIKPKTIPWHIKQAELEANKRAEAKALRAQENNLKSVDELEKELGLDDASKIS